MLMIKLIIHSKVCKIIFPLITHILFKFLIFANL
jgi:hypothetical protein